MTRYLLDANVLIALVVAEHEHHQSASIWVADADEFLVCPIVEGALVRTLLRLGESGHTAQRLLCDVRANPRCIFVPDSISFIELDLVGLQGHRQVTDAYLVGLAAGNDSLLVTFDRALADRNPSSALLLG